jgi:RsiW-degrading membrane proteinase PrsW (M82 family)
MKNTITITSSVAGILAFLFLVDITYWHVFGLSMLQFRHHMEIVVALFCLGLVLSFLATLLAASSLPRHWRSGSTVGWFISSFAAVTGFFWLLATGL